MARMNRTPEFRFATCMVISRPATCSVSAHGITAKADKMNVNPSTGAIMK
jgi:hypothetical protein